MKRKKVFILSSAVIGVVAVVIIFIVASIFMSKQDNIEAKYPSGHAKSLGEFAAKTTEKFFEDSKENKCYSPLSLYATLCLLAEATEEDTREEILAALGVEDMHMLEDYFSSINEALKVNDDSVITLCNGMWMDETYSDENTSKVMDECREKMNCDLFLCDEIKSDSVNSWISEKTNHFIDSGILIDESVLTVLANTVYYNSKWAYDMSEIDEKVFTLENGSEIETDYIVCKKTYMKYYEGKNYTIVNVLLGAGKMVFVLPNKGVKLEKLTSEKNINDILSMVTSKNMDSECINITIPKFETEDEYTSDIESVLAEIGIESLFKDSQWSLSKKMNGINIDINQTTKIELDENGIEAAAATLGVGYVGIEDVIDTKDIVLDRPFLYILMKDGVPLFIGTVYNPAE